MIFYLQTKVVGEAKEVRGSELEQCVQLFFEARDFIT